MSTDLEKRIHICIDEYISTLKNDICLKIREYMIDEESSEKCNPNQMQTQSSSSLSSYDDIMEYIHSYEKLSIHKNIMAVKIGMVAPENRCITIRPSNNIQCNRRRKMGSNFCASHICMETEKCRNDLDSVNKNSIELETSNFVEAEKDNGEENANEIEKGKGETEKNVLGKKKSIKKVSKKKIDKKMTDISFKNNERKMKGDGDGGEGGEGEGEGEEGEEGGGGGEDRYEKQVINVVSVDIQGIIYYIDKFNNVYITEDILEKKENPRILTKATRCGNTYTIGDIITLP
jgi:hypothetical protein